jgi:hypothetical protein
VSIAIVLIERPLRAASLQSHIGAAVCVLATRVRASFIAAVLSGSGSSSVSRLLVHICMIIVAVYVLDVLFTVVNALLS